MATAKEPFQCKLEIDGNIIKEVMAFQYLGVALSSYSDIQNEEAQLMKGNKVARYLNNII